MIQRIETLTSSTPPGVLASCSFLSITAGLCQPPQVEVGGARISESLVDDRMDNTSAQSDLIEAIANGSTHLYDELIKPYQRRIYRIALMHMKDEEDARDVAQESFLKAFLKLSTFRGRSQFTTWLTSITINEARNRLRQRSYQRRNLYSETSDMDNTEYISRIPDHRETPSQLIERQELNQSLERAVDNLKDDYRDVFVLRVVNELSTSETAARLKISNASVKTRLHRARVLLQASLAPTQIGQP